MYSQGIECSMQRAFCIQDLHGSSKRNPELAAGLAGFEHVSCVCVFYNGTGFRSRQRWDAVPA